MLAQSYARKPAPPLAARGMWLRLHGGADAFGSALGDSVVSAIQRGDASKVPPVASAEDKAQILAGFAGGPGGDGPALSPVYGRTFAEDRAARTRINTPDWAMTQAPTAAGAPDEEQFDFRRESLKANARSAAESQAREDFRRSEITAENAAAKARDRAAAAQLATWDGGAGGGRGFVNPPLAAASASGFPSGWNMRDASAAQRQAEGSRLYAASLANAPSMSAWDGISRDAPAVEYLKQSLGGLDPVRGDQMQFRVAQMLPDAALNEVGGLVLGKVVGRVLGWGDKVAPRVTSLDPYDSLQIINTPKGLRPLPESYLPQSMIDEHAALFQDGVARIQPNLPTGQIGRTETWVMPKSFADRAIAESAGDVGKLEQLLGLDKGYLGNAPVRVDIPRPAGLRMSSGNEYGANQLWNPGGYTNGGIPEAVINPVPPSAYKVTPIKVR